MLGLRLGDIEGDIDGLRLGLKLPATDGDNDGEIEGLRLGLKDGDRLGLAELPAGSSVIRTPTHALLVLLLIVAAALPVVVEDNCKVETETE